MLKCVSCVLSLKYRLVLIKMEVFFILEKRFLLQISFVSGVKAQHTDRKSDCFASSSKETRPGDSAIDVFTLKSNLKCCHETSQRP